MKKTIEKLLSMVIVAAICITSLFCNTAYAAEEKIPDDAVEFNGHYYKAFNTSKSWKEAKTYCENLGGYLATITTADEQNFIVDTFLKDNPAKKCYFLGGYRESISSSVWYWVTGESFSYNKWGGGENTQSDEYGQIYTIIASGSSTDMHHYQWYSHMNYDTGTSRDWAGKYTGFICEWDNIYNLGEETYGFKNYSDSTSDGHCFGMSVTSSGYYLGKLPLPTGVKSSKDLYKFAASGALKTPICYYQKIQGSVRDQAVVAGNSGIATDWDDILSYVSNHEYDGKGNLIIIVGNYNEGLHAINFLRYEIVDGQERIYVYDNNFPTQETYFYRTDDGYVKQAPSSTFSYVDGMVLMSTNSYLIYVSAEENVKKYQRTAIYSSDSISVEGATRYEMCGDFDTSRYYVYEVPEKTSKVKITPLDDNAKFTYMDKEYTFGEINEGTYAELKLPTTEEDVPEFKIINVTDEPEIKPIVKIDDLSLRYKSIAKLNSEIQMPSNYTIEYSSSNPSVATVDKDGNVTATGRGEVEITVTVTDEYGNIVEDTCKVTVSFAWWQWLIYIVLFGFIWY